MASPKATYRIGMKDETKGAFASLNANLKKTGKAFGAFGAAGVAAFAGIGAAVGKASQDVARIGDVAERLGVATEGFQELSIAADAVGVSTSSFEQGLQRLTRRAADAVDGNEALADTFRDFGLSIEEVANMTPDELFRSLGENMENIEGSGQQLLRFFRLFDVEGTDLIRVARRIGDEGFQAMIDRAKEAGAVFSDELIKQAQATRAELAILERVVTGNMQKALVTLAPLIQDISAAFVEAAPAIAQWVDSLELTPASKARAELEKVQEQMSGITATIANLQDEWRPWLKSFNDAKIADAETRLAALRDRAAELEATIRAAESRPAVPAVEGDGGRAIGESVPTPEDGERAIFNGLTEQEWRDKMTLYAEAEDQKTFGAIERSNRLKELQQQEAEASAENAEQQARHRELMLGAISSMAINAVRIAGVSESKMKPIRAAAAFGDTLAGATRAYRDHAYPLSAWIAGSIITAGFANVAAILSGGTSGGAATPSVSASGGNVDEPGGQQRLNIELRSSTGLFPESSIRQLADLLQEVSEDGQQNLSGRVLVEGI